MTKLEEQMIEFYTEEKTLRKILDAISSQIEYWQKVRAQAEGAITALQVLKMVLEDAEKETH